MNRRLLKRFFRDLSLTNVHEKAFEMEPVVIEEAVAV
jgi:hypothetical protein